MLDRATDARTGLRDLARRFLVDLLHADVLRLRRLVLAEADRFPAVSGAWFVGGFERSLALLGEALTRLADRGLLRDSTPSPTRPARSSWPRTAGPGSGDRTNEKGRAMKPGPTHAAPRTPDCSSFSGPTSWATGPRCARHRLDHRYAHSGSIPYADYGGGE
ncbi:hypothetical protein GCM10009557_89450 [Virgisporangium ochraceum]|uniref:Transcriptional regulator TetR C-terminal Proteobacteria type domain-containing protein n=1 Tax=Virgisporangium ochraceum TaxID=65505 RepID=A0A8J4EH27_9ACTN|nr:TetR/AcrR family transcriptional regulator C-terminal domain-containing protein [Virgisporangium ochraceum]GIJ71772.1 hypothetical protein Voc01_066890 [Virgisporangium ochraceum]